MRKSEITKRQPPTQQSRAYILGVFVINLCIFGSYFYTNWAMVTFGIGTITYICAVVFITVLLSTEDRDLKDFIVYLDLSKYQLLDKSLAKQSNSNNLNLIVNKSFIGTVYYYPTINTQISHVLSPSAFINVRVILLVIPHVLAILIMTENYTLIPKLTALSFIGAWSLYAALNIKPLLQILSKSRQATLDSINMEYTKKTVREMLSKQSIIYYTDKKQEVDLLEKLYSDAYFSAIDINDLIADKYTTASVFQNEIKTIEHIINYFIPTTIRTTQNYFKENRDRTHVAKTVYIRDVAPKIRKEAMDLDAKMSSIREAIKHIKIIKHELEANQLKAQRELDEKLITINKDLISLTEETRLPINDFTEFHKLNFKNTEKRVAAQNIVLGSLLQLVEMRKNTDSPSEKEKLNKQIERVKYFVKSLASGTPESKERQSRIVAKEKSNPLYLERHLPTAKDVEHIIAVNERYIESYDNTLPVDDT